MFSGLLLTSISTALVRAALFQRKAKAGFLGELDELREAALDTPRGGVGDVVDPDDIWTDLRDGGIYDNPHEISSLYATDETPDDPSKAPARAPKARTKGKGREGAEAVAAEPTASPAPAVDLTVGGYAPPPAYGTPMHHDGPVMAPATIPPAPIEDPGAPTFDPVAPATFDGVAADSAHHGTGPVAEADPLWIQPAPHPIRPEEMWHPADLVPVSLGAETSAPPAEERVSSAELAGDDGVVDGLRRFQPMDVTASPVVEHHEAVADHHQAVADHPGFELAQQLEAELVSAAEGPVGLTAGGAGLVGGPVGRRVRRDRPADRGRSVLPTPESVASSAPQPPVRSTPYDRGDTSPLPEAPLPPAALPTRPAGRISPEDPFGAQPAAAALDPTPVAEAPGAEPAPEPAAAEARFDPTAVIVEDTTPQPVAAEPVAAAPVAPAPEVPVAAAPVAPAPEVPVAAAPAAPVARPLAIAADGMVVVPGTIVRVGGARQATATWGSADAAVSVSEGWCWVAPGDGEATPLRITMPNAVLTVPAGAAALAVVEADRSTFVIVAYGSAELQGPQGTVPLERGAIVMLDPAGGAQFDHASDDEIDADPIVAENLALDAEL